MQWAFVTSRDSAASRVLLVGTKLDQPRDREVFYAEALEVAEMHFGGAYAEVSVARAPFVGVDAVERILSEWTGTGASAEQFVAPTAVASPRRSHKPCVRASVWLYDPTEEQLPSPEHDVKLRPISRALFEIRGAGHEKRKSIAKFKEREVSKLTQRSKYYGPTESSRHMRWQEEQRRSKLSQSAASAVHHMRPRSASHGAISSQSASFSGDCRREHELLAAKSFVQSTELLRQRKLELMARKALVAANASTGTSRTHGTRALANPQAARDAAQQQKRTRKFAGTTLSSVPEEERSAGDDASLLASGFKATDFPAVSSPRVAKDNVRERRATVGDLPSSYSQSAFDAAGDDCAVTSCLSSFDDLHRVDLPPRSSENELPSALDAATSVAPQEAPPTDAFDFTADIDDMLDYFDGVTLPI